MNINFKILKECHTISEWEFFPYVKKMFPQAELLTNLPLGRQLIYINNNSPILSIAHLDATMPPSHFAVGKVDSKPNHTCIFSPMVDDRLGAYTLLHLLPQLGINCDILLSEGEEVGDPTSQWFLPRKKYNWMFQFDRGGVDAVHYQYTERSWMNVLRKYFNGLTHGMFSDISYMGHLGIQGVNIGTGYYDYTYYNAWASLDDLASQILKFRSFYRRYKDVPFKTPKWTKNYLRRR